jgi:hypothetical protein
MKAPCLVALSFAALLCVAVCDGSTDKFSTFHEWFTARGGEASALKLARFPNMGTGVQTVAAVREGDAVIVAPLSTVV